MATLPHIDLPARERAGEQGWKSDWVVTISRRGGGVPLGTTGRLLGNRYPHQLLTCCLRPRLNMHDIEWRRSKTLPLSICMLRSCTRVCALCVCECVCEWE